MRCAPNESIPLCLSQRSPLPTQRMPVYCIHVCITKQGLDSCGTPAWYLNINPQAPTFRLLTPSSHTSTEGTSLWPTACSPLMMPRMHACCVHTSVPKQARYNHATLSWSPSTWSSPPSRKAQEHCAHLPHSSQWQAPRPGYPKVHKTDCQ